MRASYGDNTVPIKRHSSLTNLLYESNFPVLTRLRVTKIVFQREDAIHCVADSR